LASAYHRTRGKESDSQDAYRKTISLAEEVRKTRPKDATLLSQLGSWYASANAPEQSVPLLRQAAALAPDDPQIMYRVGGAYELLSRREDALRWIDKALAAGFSLETVERNPELAELRADRRFRAIAEKVR